MCFNNYMATSQHTADFILEQTESAGDMSARKMFGEYALYCDGKVVAFICDDRLFMKPTAAATAFLDDTHLAPAYPGSKDYYCVPEDMLEDPGWLCRFVRATWDAVPYPKPKKSKE
jgi:TfoX/Sxy family transcriptional regulator of competence genes